jgi:predicted dehydrogenase
MKKIRIGFVGAGKGSWTDNAHIPGLKHLSDKFEVTSVCTTRMETAKAAAEAHNVKNYFDNVEDLAKHENVDLVVVSIKTPHHFDACKKAILAGKSVYCEWPLGNGYKESEELARLAKEHNVKCFIGLQALSLPEINYLRDFIQQGNIGRVLSTSVIGSGLAWGNMIDPRNLYLLDKNNGATMITIPFGHTIAGIQKVLGCFKSLNALISNRRTKVTNIGDNSVHEMTSPDQLIVGGLIGDDDIPISIHYRGGAVKGTNFLWEINGEKGDIVITSNSGHLQMGSMEIKVGIGEKPLEKVEIPKEYFNGLIESKGKDNTYEYGMAHAYYNVYEDLVHNKNLTPTFEDGLKNYKIIEYIYKSNEKKQTVQVE